MDRIPRSVDQYLKEFILPTFSAVLVTGARGVGKTTSMQAITRTHLDLALRDPRETVRADPDAAIEGLDEPVLIDEWQEAPDVVNAVKRSVDRDTSPGRFVLTGSVRGPLQATTWGGTGRLIRVRMLGLTQAEIEATGRAPIDQAFEDPEGFARVGMIELDRNDYLARVVAGGFPAAFRLDDRRRSAWYDSYVAQLVERDAVDLGGVREPSKLAAVLRVVAVRSAQVRAVESMCAEAGVAKATLYTHLDLLENLQLMWSLPAWASNRLTRLVRHPKLHLSDTGLAAALLGVDARALRFEGRLAGPLLESFVARELWAAIETSVTRAALFHLRGYDGQEVDIVVESADGRVVGFEVKAATGVEARDARGLRWLRDKMGRAFVAGFVLYTGSLGYRLEDRIWAAPIAALWRPSRPSV